MANRKQQNLEIERQLKHRQYVFRGVAFAITAILLVAAAIGIWTVQDRRWVMSYDGGRVASGDFRLMFHHTFEGNEAARSAALESLQAIVVLRDRAISHNVDFTPEERQEADEIAAGIRQQWYWPGNGGDMIRYINDRRIGELFFTTPLVERLLDIYEPGYDLDEEEFAEMFEEYVETNLHNHTDMQILFIARDTEEEMEEIEAMLETMTFEEVVRETSEWLEPGAEIDTFALTDIETGGILAQLQMLSPEDREVLLGLQEGETSHTVMAWDFEFTGEPFFVKIHMVSRGPDPTIEEVEASYRERIINERRNAAFFDRVMTWVEEANFVINERGYNTV
ncbi:MAG: hypothetical protein FWE42_06720 [Defluviitaleaceae bacterium]|nr:hypothetical protein [Defluviitaleaceae bacterium]